MSQTFMTSQGISQRIALLETLSRAELVARWQKSFGSLPFKGARRGTLIRGIAYKLQEKRYGALKPSTKRQLLKIAREALEQRKAPGQKNTEKTAAKNTIGNIKPRPKLQTGSKLIREWNGHTYEVIVSDKGFILNGKTHTSLSACAKAITGAHWSGPRFFGAVA